MSRTRSGMIAGCAGLVLGVASGACTQESPANPTESSVRFAIEAPTQAVEPVYVQLNEEDGQPGWVTVYRDDERIYLQERCEIEDCGGRAVVCGLSPTMVRNLATGSAVDAVEFVWDGTTSVIDPETGCERREMAGSGEYVAELCYSNEVQLDGEGDPSGEDAVPGQVVNPTCTEMPFALEEGEEVVLRLGGG